MARAIIIRQGDAVWLAGVTGQDGELLWKNDSNDLYVGTGAGNVLIGGASGLISLDDIQDVTITAVGDGEILMWDAGTSQWINQTLAEAGIGGSEINMIWRVVRRNTALTIGDSKDAIFLPTKLNGWNLTGVTACVDTASTVGAITVSLYNVTDAVHILTVNVTIDVNEKTSYTALTPPTINAAADDVDTGDEWRCDVDAPGANAKGLVMLLKFEQP